MRRGLVTAGLTVSALLAGALPASADPGDPDVSFGGTGHVVATVADGQDNKTVLVRTGGKVILVDERRVLAQFKPNGMPDPAFGTAGIAMAPAAGAIYGAALQDDGKILLVGEQDGVFLVQRVEADGDLDPTFGGGDGIVTTSFSQFADASDAFQQPDGKIVAIGENGDETYDIAIARYRPNGTLDPTFGGDGKVTTSILGDEFAFAGAVGSDGTIVAVGVTQVPDDLVRSRFAIVRYRPNGRLDRSFSGDGKAVVNVGGDSGASAVVVRADGKVVVGGEYTHPDPDWAIVRLQENGKLDPTFGDQGKVRTIIGPGNDSFADLIRQPSGKLVAAGTNPDPANRLYVVRYRANGTLDDSFGTDGRIAEQLADTTVARAVANAPNGTIVVGGNVEDGTEIDMFAARYLAD